MDKRQRAVIYCRVSTNSDSQVESLDKQVLEAKDAAEQLGCQLVDQYIDEGKTGTTKETRKEYLRLLSDMGNNRFDVIVTKSLDRMNRNILDFYLFLDQVIKNDIKLYFYLDRNFYKTDDKIVIGIKAILAEEYSRELSKKLCNAHAKRQEKGSVIMLSSLTYGYKKEVRPDGSKEVVVVEEEAEMIRLIFKYSREGYGSRAIGKFLYERGYRNRNGNEIMESTIRRIIRNPLVMGTMIMNKVNYDFNAKQIIYTDTSKWIRKENAVPAIISEEDWNMANRMVDSRSRGMGHAREGERLGVNKGKFNFSGKIICGICGKPYYKTHRKTKADHVINWQCSTYRNFGRLNAEKFKSNSTKKSVDIGVGCDNIAVQEEELIDILQMTAVQEFTELGDKQTLIHDTLAVLKQIIHERESDSLISMQKKSEKVMGRKETLLLKFLDGKISDENYDLMEKKLEAEHEEIKKRMEAAESERDTIHHIEQRLRAIEKSLEEGGIEKATAYTVMETIERIVVYPDYLDIIFDPLKVFGINQGGILGGQKDFSVKVSWQDKHMKHYNMAIERSKDRICEMIKEDPSIRINQIAKELGIGKRTAFDRMKALREEGRIELTGHGPGSRWHVST